MIYFQQQAHPDLKSYVRCFWKLENNLKEAQDFTIFPDGFFDLLICYHNGLLKQVFLSGLFDQKVKAIVSPGTIIYGVQFRLLAVENIIQENIGLSLNKLKRLENTYLNLKIYDRLEDADFFNYLNTCLINLIEESDPIDPRKFKLLSAINETKGNKTVEHYSKESHWSSRQINRYFKTTFGLSLKSYCGIRKGSATFSQIKKGQLYPKQGYYDQAHFIKGIKKITGYTPKELLKNENDRFLQFSIIENE